MRILCSAFAIGLVLALSAAAQTGSSSLAGVVADSSNRVIPRAEVTLINEASGEERHSTTNNIGEC